MEFKNGEKIVENMAPNRVVCCFCGEIIFEFKNQIDAVEFGHEPMFKHIQKGCPAL
jgi:hypothetical protein